jgi:hypothetical protein
MVRLKLRRATCAGLLLLVCVVKVHRRLPAVPLDDLHELGLQCETITSISTEEWSPIAVSPGKLLAEGWVRGVYTDARLAEDTRSTSKDGDVTRGRRYIRALALLRLDLKVARNLTATKNDKTRRTKGSGLEDPRSPTLFCQVLVLVQVLVSTELVVIALLGSRTC